MPAFDDIVVTERLRTVRGRLEERSLDACLVGSLTNIRYLTGFTGSAGLAVITKRGGLLYVDGRYADQAREQLSRASCDFEIVVAKTTSEMYTIVGRELELHRHVGFDPTEFTVAQFEVLGDSARAMRRVDGFVAEVRQFKDEAELARIRFAAACADQALSCVPSLLHERSGLRERDVRDELEHRMRLAGADGPSYDTIVASGEHAAMPHHRPGDRVIREGDSLVIDVGALVDGYHSDMTRTFLVGDCRAELHEMYEAVREVQREAVEMVKPGVRCGDVDQWCRTQFAQRGLVNLVAHSTGHGVGLVIHESPWLRVGEEDQLTPGQVVTVEPGLYRGGVGGVRIEDLLVVTQTGHSVLTHSPKEPSCLQSPPTT